MLSNRRKFLGQLFKGVAALPFIGTLKGSRDIIDVVEPDKLYDWPMAKSTKPGPSLYEYQYTNYSLGFKISPGLVDELIEKEKTGTFLRGIQTRVKTP